MYRKERREAVEILRRFIRGEIGDDPLRSFIQSLDLRSITDLLETLEFGSEDFQKIGLREEDLSWPLRDFLRGSVTLDSLRFRIQRISQIFTAPEYQASSACRHDLQESLNLLALVLDSNASLPVPHMPAYLTPILEALETKRAVPFSSVVGMVLRDLGSFHFTTLTLPEFTMAGISTLLPWTDLALLYNPPQSCDPRGDELPEADLGPVWFIPLSVTTRRFYQEGLPARLGQMEEDSWTKPENCRVPKLRARCPALPCGEYRPAYFIDPHGFAEVILEVDALSRKELLFAIQLFAIQNGCKEASLDGEAIELLVPRGG